MTLYWMLNSHWPSFYGHIIDYYLSPGGAYYGAKKGLRPLSVVFDAYAKGDHSQARIMLFNQTPGDVQGLRVRVRVYDLNGQVIDDRSAESIQVQFNGSSQVMSLPRYPQSTPVFFVRCQLVDSDGKLLVDNTYWQSQKDDDMGDRKNDDSFDLKQDSWADMTALNTMTPVRLQVSAHKAGSERVTIRLHNPSNHIAFFERACVSATPNGDEILPILYDDNYVTVYPGETTEIHATLLNSEGARWIRLEGYNTAATSAHIE
jgi:exo-1,4-beta-D-glucosaminidase